MQVFFFTIKSSKPEKDIKLDLKPNCLRKNFLSVFIGSRGRRPHLWAPEVGGGRKSNCPLPFNILETGGRGGRCAL